MFTGIVQAVGEVCVIQPQAGDLRLLIKSGKLNLTDVQVGDSIATNGVCLTAVELTEEGFWADVSRETLEKTRIGELGLGQPVNLEKSLTLSTPLGGHLVSGHVDGVGKVVALRKDARSWRINIQAPDDLAHYIASKGSICIDGVSLTVNSVGCTQFEVNIVPHTADNTTLQYLQPGSQVHLEVDMIARYLERLLQGRQEVPTAVTLDALRQSGFVGE